jgi:Major capsid protein 13-like
MANAYTRLADIIEPVTYLQYQKEYKPEKYSILESSVVGPVDPSVASQMTSGGSIVDMPFWQDIARDEPVIQNDDPSTSVEPKKMTAAVGLARKRYIAQAWSATRLAGVVATGNGQDPLRQIVDFTTNYWRYDAQHTIVKCLDGVLADNVSNDSSDMLTSVYSDIATPLAANKISYAAVNAARLTMGDFADELGIIVCHSKVWGDMLNQEGISYIQPSNFPKNVAMFGGLTVIVNDDCTTASGSNSTKYRSYLLGPNSVSYAVHLPPDAVATQREELQGQGSGVDYLVNRRHNLIHINGFSFVSGSVAGKSATWAELATASNWNRIQNRKNIRVAFLETN